jgi:hypothetical protein
MGERDQRRISKRLDDRADDSVVHFSMELDGIATSPARLEMPSEIAEVSLEAAEAGAEAAYSPEFLELAYPKLPSLEKANRARLLMQSPNRLYFYWALGNNPYQTLNRAVGSGDPYTLVVRLIGPDGAVEEVHPIDAEGNWWFDVVPDATFRAEVGFYAFNRPFIRILYSNTVTTPRKAPSPRPAQDAEWRVPSTRFARILDASGFKRDAFDVALTGDDVRAADRATFAAFERFSGRSQEGFDGLEASELRYAMLALASGASLAELRGFISDRLFALLSAQGTDESSDGDTAERAVSALAEEFELDIEEFETEEYRETAAGGSLVNFPPKGRRRPLFPVGSRPTSHSHIAKRG